MATLLTTLQSHKKKNGTYPVVIRIFYTNTISKPFIQLAQIDSTCLGENQIFPQPFYGNKRL